MASRWNESEISNLDGKVVVITGANSGIGFETARVLANKGATVVLAVRSLAKGKTAMDKIHRDNHTAKVQVMELDLANLESIRAFSVAFLSSYNELSILINNAGVMAPPYSQTVDGFELQFGTNHLGHFALTGLLLKPLLSTESSRVVTVSSAAHKGGQIDFQTLDGKKNYRRWGAYSQSKLANLLFAYELQRRLSAHETSTLSVACHPGFAATNLTTSGMGNVAGGLANLMAQSAAKGALPTLFAATCDKLVGGEYIGPTGMGGMKGYPGIVSSSARSHDEEVASKLWDVSSELTGVEYHFA